MFSISRGFFFIYDFCGNFGKEFFFFFGGKWVGSVFVYFMCGLLDLFMGIYSFVDE